MSQVIRDSGKISMTKNLVLPEKNIETTIVATKFENGNGKNTTCMWPEYGYFKQQPCDFGVEKEDFPENSIIYLNQGYLTTEDHRKLYYADYCIIGQINERINPPEDLENYVCQDREVKLYRPHYDPVTDNFLGLYETLGFIVVRGDPKEHFLDYGNCKQNSKIINSYHKKRIRSSFGGTFFNQHKLLFESGALQKTSSNVYYFLSSTIDRSEEINLCPIPDTAFETKENVSFDPSKLEFSCQEKEIMTVAVVKMLKKISDMSNANLIKNADGRYQKEMLILM